MDSTKALCIPSMLPTENSGCHLARLCHQWGNFLAQWIQEVARIVTECQIHLAGHNFLLARTLIPEKRLRWELPEGKQRPHNWHQTFKDDIWINGKMPKMLLRIGFIGRNWCPMCFVQKEPMMMMIDRSGTFFTLMGKMGFQICSWAKDWKLILGSDFGTSF